MENFDAEKARDLVEKTKGTELHNILTDIKLQAERGKSRLNVYKHIRESTVEELKKKGFRVVSESSIAIQYGKLYYTIYWT